MPRVHTHYDNLKVARDAPMEVIHAAYRSLAAMYHPDRHPGDVEAERIMRIINKSYLALCDPARKRDHDRWIESIEPPESNVGQEPRSHPIPESPPVVPTRSESKREAWLGKYSLQSVVGFFILAALVWALYYSFSTGPTTTTARPEYTATPLNPPAPSETFTVVPPREAVQLHPRYVRPSAAPNGDPWPRESGYLGGFEQRNTGGRSNLTVDNRRSDSDALVSIYDHTYDQPMRVFFLLAGDQFTAEALLPGDYDVRYMDLGSGLISRSEPLRFREVRDEQGVHWHNSTVTLYQELDPEHPIHFETISPNEFVKTSPH